jgi:hypothetical protein
MIVANTCWGQRRIPLVAAFLLVVSCSEAKPVQPQPPAQSVEPPVTSYNTIAREKLVEMFQNMEHSVDTLHQRNEELATLAHIHGVTYEGMDVGPQTKGGVLVRYVKTAAETEARPSRGCAMRQPS